MANQYSAHQALVAEILALCGSRPDCRLWPNNTGVGRGLTHDGVIKFGLKGSADIIGIGRQHVCAGPPHIRVPINTGVFLAIEAKTGSGTQSAQQKAFQAMVEKFGGFYLVARSAEDVKNWLDKVLG